MAVVMHSRSRVTRPIVVCVLLICVAFVSVTWLRVVLSVGVGALVIPKASMNPLIQKLFTTSGLAMVGLVTQTVAKRFMSKRLDIGTGDVVSELVKARNELEVARARIAELEAAKDE